ncbi:MAG TPA: class I SAM-dependent methyltransferase [Thermoanaerobaculia bacterium]
MAAQLRNGMNDLGYLDFVADFSSPEIVNVYDELPLWSAMFGLMLLEFVPFAGVRTALDVGCGTGFPLIELAERLGPSAQVHGVDLWSAGLARVREKVRVRKTPNVTLHECSAVSLPFPPATFDLIVSNLGINNFDDREATLRECRRVAKPGATIALTTNLQGHMRELYDVFASVLDVAGRTRLREHVEHRATVSGVKSLLSSAGFSVHAVHERESVMRFANGTALLNHHFIKLGFLDGWKAVADDSPVFDRLQTELDRRGELTLTIPMAYVEGRAE